MNIRYKKLKKQILTKLKNIKIKEMTKIKKVLFVKKKKMFVFCVDK